MIPIIKQPLEFDHSLPVNTGVQAVYMVGFSNTVTMRMVIYENPEDGRTYEYITSNDDLEPGVIAWLYFLRWRIEKSYDLFKNRYCEKKGWATKQAAQLIQSSMTAITHNLLMFLKHYLDKDADLGEEKLNNKRQKAIRDREEKALSNGRFLHPLTYHHPIMQLSAQFVRTIQNLFWSTRPLSQNLEHFRRMLTSYI